MDTRYQVFVSSTFSDLREERGKVIQAILDQDHIPTGMELWPASDPAAWRVIEGYLKQCDYYVVIIGGRYGSVPPESTASFTEMEYDKAYELKVPVLAFVHSSPGEIPAKHSEQNRHLQERLKQFVEKLKSRHLVKEWSNADQLQYLVSNALRHAIKAQPRVGWIRADYAIDPRVFAELDELRRRNSELDTRVRLFESSAPAASAEFAGLDTTIEIPYIATVEKRLHSNASSYHVTETSRIGYSMRSVYASIFKRFGFLAINGATTSDLRELLAQICLDNSKLVLPHLSSDEFVVSVEIQQEHVDQLIIQFMTLGLLEYNKTGGRDCVWNLTKYGETELVKLTARPKHDAGSS